MSKPRFAGKIARSIAQRAAGAARWLRVRKKPTLLSLSNEITKLGLKILPEQKNAFYKLSEQDSHQIMVYLKAPTRLTGKQKQEIDQLTLEAALEFFGIKQRGEKVEPIEKGQRVKEPLNAYIEDYIRKHKPRHRQSP